MEIVKAELTDLPQCVDILFISEIGKLYFPRKEFLHTEMEKSIYKDEIFVAKLMKDTKNINSDIQGVIWYQREGLFHSFSYLHMLAVRDEYRHQGIGAMLMNFYEQDSLQSGKNRIRTKTFLLVSDFNTSAHQFYLNRGYVEICRYDNLFRRGITEILLMKIVTVVK